ncbi:MAG: mechanosensitive ion channel family protein [Planctomycetota bacterium]
MTILIGFGLLFCGFLLGLIVITVIHPLLTRLAKMTKNEQDDLLIGAIKYPLEKFFQVVGVSIAAYWWAWPIHQGDPTNLVYAIIVQFFFVCMWLVAGAFLWKFADFIVGILTEIAQSTETKFDDQLVQPIKSTLRASVAIFVGLMLIQSVGWDIGAILAGLGLGGIAFALAGQETIKNLFGSITVFADRPFRIGDTIAVGDVKGTVESIGFRSTRVRTWDQTEVTMPNKQFTDSRVENLTRRKVRRFTANFGCTYDTTREQMTLLVDGIRVLLNKIDAVDKESITVYFTEFGESSINLLVRASITELNYAKYMSIVQDLNFAIWALYDELGVAMAFPTRTLEFGTSAIDALSALGGKGATKAAAATKSTTTKAAAKKKTTPASKKKGGRSAGAKVAARAEGASLKTSDRTDADLDLTD